MSVNTYEQQWSEAEDAYYAGLQESADHFGNSDDDLTGLALEQHDAEQAYLEHFRDIDTASTSVGTRGVEGSLGRVTIKDSRDVVVSFTPRNAWKGLKAIRHRDRFKTGIQFDGRREFNSPDALVRYREGTAPSIEDSWAAIETDVDALDLERKNFEESELSPKEKRTHWTRATHQEGKIDLTLQLQEDERKIKRRKEFAAAYYADLELYDAWLNDRDTVEHDEGSSNEEIDGFYREQYELDQVKPSSR